MTLRARTTVLAAAVTAVVLAVASVLLLSTLTSQLTDAGDAADRAQVRDLLARAAEGELPATLTNLSDESVAQVVDDDGEVVAASPNARDGRAFAFPPSDDGRLEQATVDGPDDQETERYRVWTARGPSPDGEVSVVVGRSVESVDEATRTLRRSLLVGVPALLALLVAVTWLVVGRALSRIDRITTTVATIGGSGGGGDLDRRVPDAHARDEVGRLTTTMNAMLDRLDDAARRQRAFVADASHDLQSPLTALRTQLETALVDPGSVDVERWARQMLATSADMELLVQDLLALAVAEGVTTVPTTTLLDLDQIVLEEAARARPATDVVIDTLGVSAAPVQGDPTALHRLTRNLVDNAVRHAAQRVTLTLATGPDAVVLDVVDDGPGVAQDERELVFDRFYRGDPSRGRGEGSGLGLAIARRLAEQHGGSLQLVAPPDGGPWSHFRLALPLPDR